MLNFRLSLDEYFDSSKGTIDARDLCLSLVIYANQFYNYYQSGDCEIELKKEMKAKARRYKLRFIADHKKQVIKDFKQYSDCPKEFKTVCKKICCRNWDDFFLVLDWVKNNWSWESGDHYFESFLKFSENEPTIIHDYYFEEYARALGEECYLDNILRDNEHNPILDFIDWGGWAEFVERDYTEVSNPLNTSRSVYYRNY